MRLYPVEIENGMPKACQRVESEAVEDIFLIRSGRNCEKYDQDKIENNFDIVSVGPADPLDLFNWLQRQFYFTKNYFTLLQI